jgi:predicted SAM-dependent methyltransferase
VKASITLSGEGGLPHLLIRVARHFRRSYRALRRQRRTAERNRAALARIRERGHEICLELGSGPKKGVNGWLTVDIVEGADLHWDLTRRLPFDDNEVSRIYCSHLLEHFGIRELVALLADCRRILRSGGVMSVAVPNARIYLDGYQASETFDGDRFFQYRPAVSQFGRIDIVNYIAYMDGAHRYMFDEENLLAVLRSADFSAVKLRGFDEELDRQDRDYESLYALAIK